MDQLIYFDFSQKSSLLLIFFFNGIVFSYLLLKKSFTENRRDSKWLGIFVMLCSLYICPFMLGYAGWYAVDPYRDILFFVPFQQLFLIGPIIYFYTHSLLNKEFKLTKRQGLHFLPAAAYLLYSLVVFIGDVFVYDQYYFYADGRDKDLDFWYQMAGLLSMLFYLVLSLKHYRHYRSLVVQEVSFAESVLFKWIRNFMLAFAFILILRVFFFILNPEWGQFGSKFWYYLCFSVLFFYIAISGYFNTVRTSFSFAPTLPLTADTNAQKSTSIKTDNDLADLENWKSKIIALIEDQKVYTNPNLTLTEVAQQLNTNRSLISSVINQGFQKNFNDFINSKRIEAVKDKIKAGEHTSRTLLGIALDCGFNSKATFNRAFKKHMSLTPKQYITKNGH